MSNGTAFVDVRDLLTSFDASEIWRPIKGWIGYSVSSWGRVSGPRTILSPANVCGYERVCLSDGTRKMNFTVHRLVALAFWGEPMFEGAIVAHNDGDRMNNRASNLRWASALENQADRKRHNTRVHGSSVQGAKLKEEDIPAIRTRVRQGAKLAVVAEEFGVSKSTIHLISVGKIWKNVGGASWR